MGATLSKPVLCTVLERHGSKFFCVGLAELNGWRNNMEDAHVVHVGDGEGYFGILDGHGGADCSVWCAKRLHEVLAAQGCPKGDAAAKKMVLDVDREFFEQGLTGGSTAAMCVVRHPTSAGGKFGIHVINAGDSRVLLSRACGAMAEGPGTDGGLTTDHKPGHPSERARIERCGGTVESALGGVLRVNGELSVSRGFGDREHKKTGGPAQEDRPVTCDPEMGHFECDATDFLVIVCDGVSEGTFPNAEVCQLAARVLAETGGDAAKASEAVCLRAVETESKDNVSCMVVLLRGAPPAGGAAVPIAMGTRREFNAGPLLGCGDAGFAGFVKAYVSMCERGGVSFAEAVEQRHATLTARQGNLVAQDDDGDELAYIGEPAGAPRSAERKAWFEEWARARQAGEGVEDDGGGKGTGGMADGPAAQQMAMMQMLRGMMQGAEGDSTGGEGKGMGGPGRGAAGSRGGGMGRGRGQ